MDWIMENALLLGGALVLLIVGAEGKVMWEQIRPKSLRYTPKGLILAAAGALTLWSVWKLVAIITGGEPISSVIAQMFLVTMGCITMVAVGGYLLVRRVHWRLRIIEKHCGLSVME
jgi:hypothetical protein